MLILKKKKVYKLYSYLRKQLDFGLHIFDYT